MSVPHALGRWRTNALLLGAYKIASVQKVVPLTVELPFQQNQKIQRRPIFSVFQSLIVPQINVQRFRNRLLGQFSLKTETSDVATETLSTS